VQPREIFQVKQKKASTHQPTKAQLLKRAQTFKVIAQNARANIWPDLDDFLAIQFSEDDLDRYFETQATPEARKEHELSKTKGGLLGYRDYIAKSYGLTQYWAYKLRYWTRKQLYNRLRWLRGEVTRIMEGAASAKVLYDEQGRPLNRPHTLAKRREQIAMYQLALERYALFHEVLRSYNRNMAKRKRRAAERKRRRKEELAAALAVSRRL
jgi:hypothetical protein